MNHTLEVASVGAVDFSRGSLSTGGGLTLVDHEPKEHIFDKTFLPVVWPWRESGPSSVP